MKMTIEMPVVSDCAATECAYNLEEKCHARAITVGDSVHPGCDTFLNAPRHARGNQQMAGVGACKVSGCTYNEDFECTAAEITVGQSAGEISCLTFRAT